MNLCGCGHDVGDHGVEIGGCFYRKCMCERVPMCPNCVTPWKCNGPHLIEEVRCV